MKTLNNYISEALIKKDTKIDFGGDIDILDKSFDNIDELIDALTIYFKPRLEKPIKLMNTKKTFKANSLPKIARSGATVKYVSKYFLIRFKQKNDSYAQPIIRFGVMQNNENLIVTQFGEKYKTIGLKWYTPSISAYKLGDKKNFLEWIKNIFSDHSQYKKIFFND